MTKPYYAKDGVVWKHPVHKKNNDGTTTITVGFPVCEMHDAVGADAAETVAELMNLGDASPDLLTRLKAIMTWHRNWDAPFHDDDEWIGDRDLALAAIAKAEGLTPTTGDRDG